jgi:hypothetical protein
MAKDYLVRLSVHPCIRKYLLFHYSEPFFVTEIGFIPAFIYNALEPITKVNAADVHKKDKVNYGEFFGFMVGEGTGRKKGISISSDNVKRFNAAVMDLLHEEMYRLITQLAKAGYQVDQTIREFQAMYNFTEDELPFENLKRWYYRERLRLESRAAERREVYPQFTLNFFEEAKENRQLTNSILGQVTSVNLLFAS